MITISDNGAADTIYNRVGDAGLNAAAKRAGMTQFTVAGYWGNAQIAAGDMARFFGDLDRQFPRRFREYAKGLLGSITESQRWGVPAVAGDRWAVRIKGGWLPDHALVHQAAELREREGARSLAIVVLTDEQPSFTYGVETVEGSPRACSVGTVALRSARSGSKPTPPPPPPLRVRGRPGLLSDGPAAPFVDAVGDDLRAQRAAHPLELRVHLALELGGALAHPRELRAGPLELALEIEHRLDPGQVEALVGGHLLDPAQPLDVLVGVEARVLRASASG